MAKQIKTMMEIIPDQLIDKLVDVVVPIAPPETRAPELKARVMARIRGKKSFDLMTVRAGEGEWIILMPGVEKKILSEDPKGQVQSYLLKMAPETALPAHEHLADEECFMLEGEITFGDIHLSAGDYHFAPKGSTHEQAFTKTGGMAFLRAYEPMD